MVVTMGSNDCTYDEYGNPISCPDGDASPTMQVALWCLTAISLGFLCSRLCLKIVKLKRLLADDTFLVLSWVNSSDLTYVNTQKQAADKVLGISSFQYQSDDLCYQVWRRLTHYPNRSWEPRCSKHPWYFLCVVNYRLSRTQQDIAGTYHVTPHYGQAALSHMVHLGLNEYLQRVSMYLLLRQLYTYGQGLDSWNSRYLLGLQRRCQLCRLQQLWVIPCHDTLGCLGQIALLIHQLSLLWSLRYRAISYRFHHHYFSSYETCWEDWSCCSTQSRWSVSVSWFTLSYWVTRTELTHYML